jgi:phage terminase large subunit-like protein
LPRHKHRAALPKLGSASDALEETLAGLKGSDRVWTFLRTFCRHPKGIGAGKPFTLAPWQRKDIVEPLYDTLRPDGKRQFRQGYLSFARKSGKTTLTAGLALYHLFADNEYGAEVYAAASTRDQAAQLFDIARAMVEMDPVLRARAQISEHSKRIRDPKTNSIFRALAADAPAQHGLNGSFIVLDEIAQQPNRELYDVLSTSVGSRTQPLVLSIGTAGWDEHSIAYQLYQHGKQVIDGTVNDPSFFACIKELPTEADWTDESLWPLANPGLDDFRDRQELKETCERAKLVPANQNSFRNLYCNQWVKSEVRWIPVEELDKCEPINVDLLGKRCYLALDAGSTRDLSSLVHLFPLEDGTIAIYPRYWLPEEDLQDMVRRDRVPYDQWVKEGHLELTEGRTTKLSVIEDAIREAYSKYSVQMLAYDPWSTKQLAENLERDLGAPIFKFEQNIGKFTAPTKDYEKRILNHEFRHNRNPIYRWNLDCVTIYSDANGNARPVKPDRMKDSRRIDGIVASIMALAVLNQGENDGPVFGMMVFDPRSSREKSQ